MYHHNPHQGLHGLTFPLIVFLVNVRQLEYLSISYQNSVVSWIYCLAFLV